MSNQDDPNLRHRNNLIATAFILLLAIGAVWVVKSMLAYEKDQRCLSSGRRDCVEIAAPPRATP